MKLSEPRPKKHCGLNPSLPLPLLQSTNSKDNVYQFQGRVLGYNVIIEDEDEMKKIVSMGYFGKANFSRSFPTFLQKKAKDEILRKRQFERRKEWGKKLKDKKMIRKCIVMPDSDEEEDNYFVDLKPQYEIDSSGIKENVHLCLEEAFFLKKFVNCLRIKNGNSELTCDQTWELFKETDSNFLTSYIAYHYYRAKNWVVKPGTKFGGDYLLYKQGPPFYHASYVIIIDTVNEEMERIENLKRRNMDMVSIQGLNRVCETAGKELIICKLVWPKSLINVCINDIQKFQIKEVLMRRWLPSVERNAVEYD